MVPSSGQQRMFLGGLVVIQAIILNGPHKDCEIQVCPHAQYHDLKMEDGQLAEYKLNKIHGTYYLVFQGTR